MFPKIAANIVCNPAAYHYRAFYIKTLDSAPKVNIASLLVLKIRGFSFFFKLLPTSCATQQHTITDNSTQKFRIRHSKFTYIPFYYYLYLKSAQLCVSLNCCRYSVKPGSITFTLATLFYIEFGFSTEHYVGSPSQNNLLETGNMKLHVEKSCLFSFLLHCCHCCFHLGSNQFQSVLHLKLDLEPQMSLDISSKQNSMQRNIVHKLFIIMIDLIQIYTQKTWLHTPLYAPVERTPSF